ncbi:MAG: hypothetical protein WAM71_15460, partial [Candidatus Korobacteraceae bacterium]
GGWKLAAFITRKQEHKLRFDVNGQSYVLSFNPNEGRWYLLTPSIDGRVKAIPVIDDAAGFIPNIVVPMGDEGPAVVN